MGQRAVHPLVVAGRRQVTFPVGHMSDWHSPTSTDLLLWGVKTELWFHVDATQREPVLVLRLGFGERTDHSPCLLTLDARLQFLGGTHQALAVDASRVRKDGKGPYTPLRCFDVEP